MADRPKVVDDVVDDEENPLLETPDDIDPGAWLGDTTTQIGRFTLSNGKTLKLASLTDAEEIAVRRGTSKVNPTNPKGPRVFDWNRYRRAFIAESINKAYDKHLGDAGYVTPDSLGGRPAGELTSIMKRIMELSGQSGNDDGSSDTPVDFFG